MRKNIAVKTIGLAAALMGSAFASPAEPIRNPEKKTSEQLEAASAQSHRQKLLRAYGRLRTTAEIDTLQGLSDDDKAFLRARHKTLNPLD